MSTLYRKLLRPVTDFVSSQSAGFALAENLDRRFPDNGKIFKAIETACHEAISAGGMCVQGTRGRHTRHCYLSRALRRAWAGRDHTRHKRYRTAQVACRVHPGKIRYHPCRSDSTGSRRGSRLSSRLALQAVRLYALLHPGWQYPDTGGHGRRKRAGTARKFPAPVGDAFSCPGHAKARDNPYKCT